MMYNPVDMPLVNSSRIYSKDDITLVLINMTMKSSKHSKDEILLK